MKLKLDFENCFGIKCELPLFVNFPFLGQFAFRFENYVVIN